MKAKEEIAVFWFRRDLRLSDNHALFKALTSGCKVLPIFIFDEEIISELPKNDPRVEFIHNSLNNINNELKKYDASLFIKKGKPLHVFIQLLSNYNLKEVYFNKDYEPYAINRDLKIIEWCNSNKIKCFNFKDHVIFEECEILKKDNSPYTVYTPYKNKWIEKMKKEGLKFYPSELFAINFLKINFKFSPLNLLGFKNSEIQVSSINIGLISEYEKTRNIPLIKTSRVSLYLRFGVISIRKLVQKATEQNENYLNELVWREFFIQILYHFPQVVSCNFKPKYNNISYRNNENEFKLWCLGRTGYPIVDAGMNELNKTGFMHNRVRMIVASFLTKHLLIDWRWGEAYFAEKLLDFELSVNNGNWQWVAGTGCDSAPYFRVFNPVMQQQKFDPDFMYIKKWNPDYKEIPEIVNHKFARLRYLDAVKLSLI